MRRYHETFRLWEYLLFTLVTLAVLCLCVCVGSVRIPLADTLSYFAARLTGGQPPAGLVSSILPIRLPRVLCVALTGAALSLAGAAMQGLLKNPLADGSTLGVSSGASLGAVIAIAFGVTLPGLPFAGTMGMAIVFAFLSLLVILGLSYKLDRSLSTNTIILIGVIFSMFVSNTATAAMMLTFLTPVFAALPANGKGRIALTMSIPIAANLGGMGTPIGTPPNMIALKFLNDPAGLNMGIDFGHWMAFMFPLVIILLIISWRILLFFFPFSKKTIELEIKGSVHHGWRMNVVIVTFIITILLWVIPKSVTGIDSYNVAMVPIGVFAVTGVITAKDLQEINWSVIWMVAGGFALGFGMNGSGLADAALESIPFGEWSPIVILLISGLICYILSNFISNTATAALLVPILAVVCTGMGDKLHALGGTSTVLIGIAIAASSAMCLPISTPPNAIAYSTGLVKQNDMLKMGLICGIVSLVLGYSVLYFIGKSGFLL